MKNILITLFILIKLFPLQGLPVFAIGVGLSTFDKASVSIMIKDSGCVDRDKLEFE